MTSNNADIYSINIISTRAAAAPNHNTDLRGLLLGARLAADLCYYCRSRMDARARARLYCEQVGTYVTGYI